MRSFKYHINSVIYNLFYPGFLGSMIYDLFLAAPANASITYWTPDTVLKWLITVFYSLDYFHLYGDVDREVKLEDRTILYLICDVIVSLLFFGAYFFTKNLEYGNAVVLICGVPIFFFIYKLQLKRDVLFHCIYMGAGVLALFIYLYYNKFRLFTSETIMYAAFLKYVLIIGILGYLFYILFVYTGNKKIEQKND